MSYTVLAVKWRPKAFDALVGQAHVVTALVNSLDAERLHHAYLFSGTRGVGKTTVARILAKAFNCEKGVTSTPCGECSACVSIDEGRFVDLIEVDAASRTRVDDTRELLDNVQYMPTRGRFKVYLIDEVHMLSNHSFNALLKTLEEPPPHVKFLFATTDPQKLPVTVLSRCLQFNLKKLPPALIHQQLDKICAAENVESDPEALSAIAKAAAGSMRDALSLLDQGIAFGGGAISGSEIKTMLGSIDRGHVIRILEALAREDASTVLSEVDSLDEAAPDYGAVLDELMSTLQQVAIVQLVAERADGEEGAALEALAGSMSPEDVQLFYQIAVNGRRDIAVCRDERMSFEMTLLRMLAFRLEDADAPAESTKAKPAVVRAKHTPAKSQNTVAPTVAKRNNTSAGGDAVVADSWPGLVKAAKLRGAVKSLADHCELGGMASDRIELIIAAENANFNTDQVRGRLEQALSAHLGRETRVKIAVGEPPRATPAEVRQANEDERMRQAREAIERDPAVKAVQSLFDAVLEPDSIQPVQSKTP